MNKILLLTTKGCEGCFIMENNTTQAVDNSSKNIKLIVKDKYDVSKVFLKENKIVDFPTVLFMKDEKVIFKYAGSMPSIVVSRWIDIHF